MSIRTAALLAMVFFAVWSFFHWRRAVKVGLVLLVFEGALRKWIIPEAQDLAYFVKDAMLLAAYFGFLVRGRGHTRPCWFLPRGIAVLLSLAAAYGLLQIFNPRLPSIGLGLLGFRSYYLYAPLALVLPAVFPTDRSLWTFLQRYLLLCIPVGLLAALQFFSPATSPLNVYVRGGSEAVMSFGTSSYVRVTSTFSYISGFSSYLLASAILLVGALAAIRWRFHVLLYLGLGITLVGMFMTGSRGVVYILTLLLPVFLVFLLAERGGGANIVRIIFVAILMAVAIGAAVPEATEAFRGRASGTTDTLSRLTLPFISPLKSLEHGGWLGLGIGATHQAGTALLNVPEPYWLKGSNTEAETGRVMLELGPIGFFLLYAVRIHLALVAVRAARYLKTRFHRTMALTSLLMLLAQLLGTIVFDPVAGLFFWFFVGLLNVAIGLDKLAPAALVARPRSHPQLAPLPPAGEGLTAPS